MHNDEFKDSRLWAHVDPTRYYKPKEVAEELLFCARSTVYEFIYCGALKVIKVGSTYRIPGWSVIEYIREHSSED